MNYRYCAVPLCTSTSIKTPNKLFITVPYAPKLRQKWHLSARRDPGSLRSNFKFCEDHFDLEKDMENYTQWKLMGGVGRVRMRKGVLPHKFDCQKRVHPTGHGTAATVRRKRAKFCSVTGCINGRDSISIGVSYHEFPIDKALQAEWVRFCGRPAKWRPGTWAHICSNHFSEDQLDRTTSPSHPKLIEGARPNVLLVNTGNKELYNSNTKYNKKKASPSAAAVQPCVANFEPEVVIKEEPIDTEEDPVPSTSGTDHEFRTDHELINPCTDDSFQSGTTPTLGEVFTVIKTEPVDEDDEPQTNSNGNTKKATKRKAAEMADVGQSESTSNEDSATKNGNAKDHFDVYGEYIAAKLRKLDWKSCAHVQKAFGDILFDAEMGKFK